MTGFGRSQGEANGDRWAWEIRAVNGKGFDVRMRLPHGFERHEIPFRKKLSQAVFRGNLQVNLTIERDAGAKGLAVNKSALNTVLKVINEIDSSNATTLSSAAEILALRGILDSSEPQGDEEHQTQFAGVLSNGLDEAILQLNDHRSTEGTSLQEILSDQLQRIADLTKRAEDDPSRSSEAIKSKLQDQLSRVLDASNAVDEDRVQQEVALLATKSDIREELDRLVAHAEAARNLIEGGSPVGRKLEFLAQEFNRESNTLCSKSNAVSLTEIGLEMKVVIDQFREQILNVE